MFFWEEFITGILFASASEAHLRSALHRQQPSWSCSVTNRTPCDEETRNSHSCPDESQIRIRNASSLCIIIVFLISLFEPVGNRISSSVERCLIIIIIYRLAALRNTGLSDQLLWARRLKKDSMKINVTRSGGNFGKQWYNYDDIITRLVFCQFCYQYVDLCWCLIAVRYNTALWPTATAPLTSAGGLLLFYSYHRLKLTRSCGIFGIYVCQRCHNYISSVVFINFIVYLLLVTFLDNKAYCSTITFLPSWNIFVTMFF